MKFPNEDSFHADGLTGKEVLSLLEELLHAHCSGQIGVEVPNSVNSGSIGLYKSAFQKAVRLDHPKYAKRALTRLYAISPSHAWQAVKRGAVEDVGIANLTLTATVVAAQTNQIKVPGLELAVMCKLADFMCAEIKDRTPIDLTAWATLDPLLASYRYQAESALVDGLSKPSEHAAWYSDPKRLVSQRLIHGILLAGGKVPEALEWPQYPLHDNLGALKNTALTMGSTPLLQVVLAHGATNGVYRVLAAYPLAYQMVWKGGLQMMQKKGAGKDTPIIGGWPAPTFDGTTTLGNKAIKLLLEHSLPIREFFKPLKMPLVQQGKILNVAIYRAESRHGRWELDYPGAEDIATFASHAHLQAEGLPADLCEPLLELVDQHISSIHYARQEVIANSILPKGDDTHIEQPGHWKNVQQTSVPTVASTGMEAVSKALDPNEVWFAMKGLEDWMAEMRGICKQAVHKAYQQVKNEFDKAEWQPSPGSYDDEPEIAVGLDGPFAKISWRLKGQEKHTKWLQAPEMGVPMVSVQLIARACCPPGQATASDLHAIREMMLKAATDRMMQLFDSVMYAAKIAIHGHAAFDQHDIWPVYQQQVKGGIVYVLGFKDGFGKPQLDWWPMLREWNNPTHKKEAQLYALRDLKLNSMLGKILLVAHGKSKNLMVPTKVLFTSTGNLTHYTVPDLTSTFIAEKMGVVSDALTKVGYSAAEMAAAMKPLQQAFVHAGGVLHPEDLKPLMQPPGQLLQVSDEIEVDYSAAEQAYYIAYKGKDVKLPLHVMQDQEAYQAWLSAAGQELHHIGPHAIKQVMDAHGKTIGHAFKQLSVAQGQFKSAIAKTMIPIVHDGEAKLFSAPKSMIEKIKNVVGSFSIGVDKGKLPEIKQLTPEQAAKTKPTAGLMKKNQPGQMVEIKFVKGHMKGQKQMVPVAKANALVGSGQAELMTTGQFLETQYVSGEKQVVFIKEEGHFGIDPGVESWTPLPLEWGKVKLDTKEIIAETIIPYEELEDTVIDVDYHHPGAQWVIQLVLGKKILGKHAIPKEAIHDGLGVVKGHVMEMANKWKEPAYKIGLAMHNQSQGKPYGFPHPHAYDVLLGGPSGHDLVLQEAAAKAIDELMHSGGFLTPAHEDAFLKKIIAEPTILQVGKTVSMKGKGPNIQQLPKNPPHMHIEVSGDDGPLTMQDMAEIVKKVKEAAKAKPPGGTMLLPPGMASKIALDLESKKPGAIPGGKALQYPSSQQMTLFGMPVVEDPSLDPDQILVFKGQVHDSLMFEVKTDKLMQVVEEGSLETTLKVKQKVGVHNTSMLKQAKITITDQVVSNLAGQLKAPAQMIVDSIQTMIEAKKKLPREPMKATFSLKIPGPSKK